MSIDVYVYDFIVI